MTESSTAHSNVPDTFRTVQEQVTFHIYVSPKKLSNCGYWTVIGFVHATPCTCGDKYDEIIRIEHAAVLLHERASICEYHVHYNVYDQLARQMNAYLLRKTYTTFRSGNAPYDWERRTCVITRDYQVDPLRKRCNGSDPVHAHPVCTCRDADLIRSIEDVERFFQDDMMIQPMIRDTVTTFRSRQ